MLSLQVDAPAWQYASDAAVADYYDRLLSAAAEGSGRPGGRPHGPTAAARIEAITEVAIDGASRRERRIALGRATCRRRRYFAALGVPVQTAVVSRGRMHLLRSVAIVNHEMARRFWGEPARARST